MFFHFKTMISPQQLFIHKVHPLIREGGCAGARVRARTHIRPASQWDALEPMRQCSGEVTTGRQSYSFHLKTVKRACWMSACHHSTCSAFTAWQAQMQEEGIITRNWTKAGWVKRKTNLCNKNWNDCTFLVTFLLQSCYCQCQMSTWKKRPKTDLLIIFIHQHLFIFKICKIFKLHVYNFCKLFCTHTHNVFCKYFT